MRAERRALLSAAFVGSAVGLSLGAVFLAAGMARHAADHAHAQRIAEAAAEGYAGSYLEAQGHGLRLAFERYGFRSAVEATDTRLTNAPSAAARRRAELDCLTEAVYYEARGESARGQAAVAQVVMNRVKHPAFPKTVCAVVFQGAGRRGCQFSFACDGSMRAGRELLAWNRARDVAARALVGAARADIGSATHFHTTAVSPIWAPQMLRVANVGAHVFYRFSPYRLRTAPVEAKVEHAVLTAGSVEATPELRLMPAMVEATVEASLEPVSALASGTPAAAKPAAAPAPAQTDKPADAALKAPQPVASAAS